MRGIWELGTIFTAFLLSLKLYQSQIIFKSRGTNSLFQKRYLHKINATFVCSDMQDFFQAQDLLFRVSPTPPFYKGI